jgi:hypothetical protein
MLGISHTIAKLNGLFVGRREVELSSHMVVLLMTVDCFSCGRSVGCELNLQSGSTKRLDGGLCKYLFRYLKFNLTMLNTHLNNLAHGNSTLFEFE